MKKIEKKRLNICLTTSPRPKASERPLKNFIEILLPLSNYLFFITGNEGKAIMEKYKDKINGYCINYFIGQNIITRYSKVIFLQFRISYKIISLVNKVDVFIFFMSEGLILPLIILKLLRKPTILALASSWPTIVESRSIESLIGKLSKYIEIICYSLSNKIVIYSPSLLKEWNLEKYRNKIYISHEHFLDFNKFKITRKFNKRSKIVGYIGRLSEEKGILNFIQSIPGLLKEMKDLEFLIVGEGPLKDEIELYLGENKLHEKVRLVGWISKENLPSYYNKLNMIVIPSYTEGLPNVMLEAIVCGTPVVANSVGVISDIIKDGETGFIIEDNNPECIKKTIIRALQDPNLEIIIENARKYVIKEFTYEAAVNRYKEIINEISR